MCFNQCARSGGAGEFGFGLGISSGYFGVQDYGEGCPGGVGDHGQGGGFVYIVYGADVAEDQGFKKDSVGQGFFGLMLAEEEEGPLGVGDELGFPETESVGAGWRVLGAPGAPSGDGHQRVESGPDGGEDFVGRVEGGLVEAFVPETGFGIFGGIARAEPGGGGYGGSESEEGGERMRAFCYFGFHKE